ncbi:MAG TPA: alpha/beta hydrolase [Candidatus Macondimonas sp.]|nr:alpha/beta hydrolase [Candidatus Macondimonas sp.]
MEEVALHGPRVIPGTVWSYPVGVGIELRGREFLRGRPSLLHFVHGNGLCGLVYWPMLRSLVETRDLCLHDTQGHGDSDNGHRFPGWNLSAERMAQAVHHRRRRIWKDRQIVGCGHSFGAILTLLAAARYPSLFDAIVLLDPVIYPPWIAGTVAVSYYTGLSRYNPMAVRARRRTSIWPDRQAALDYFQDRGMFAGWRDDALQCYVDHALAVLPDGRLTLKCPPWMESQVFAGFPRGVWTAVQRLACPTLMLYGQHTYRFIPAAMRQAQALNPLIQVRMMPGNHFFMQQMPDRTSAAMDEWLAARRY